MLYLQLENLFVYNQLVPSKIERYKIDAKMNKVMVEMSNILFINIVITNFNISWKKDIVTVIICNLLH